MTEYQFLFRRLEEMFLEISKLFGQLATVETADEGKKEKWSDPQPIPSSGSEGSSEGQRAIRVLRNRGVTVRNASTISEQEEGLVSLSALIAKKHDHVRILLDRIKRNQSTGQRFDLSLRNESQEAISDITQIARLAFEAGLVDEFRYKRAPYCLLTCRPSRSPMAINFFTGGWLELFIVKCVRDIMETLPDPTDLDAVFRAQVLFPNSDQFDLDAFLIVGGKSIWIEAKTGNDFTHLLDRYSRIRQMICESSRDAVLLWAGYNAENRIQSLRGQIADMTLCSVESFEPYLKYLLSTGEQTFPLTGKKGN